MPRTRVVIQSRLNSSRLPGKAMLDIAGMPLIELVARRASRGGHEVIVATSEEAYDTRIADHLADVGLPVLRGSLDDVLGRFVAATADLDDEDRLVRLTGDNPLVDAGLVDELLDAMDSTGHIYGRVDIEQVPEGLGAEAFTVRALRDADSSATAAYDREHVTPWLRRTYGELLFVPRECPSDIHAYRATVDTLSDYVRMAALFRNRPNAVDVPWQEVMADLVHRVDEAGPRVPRRVGAPDGMSLLVLTATRFDEQRDGESAEARSARLRAVLTLASERGVSHIDVGREDGLAAELLRATSEPALTKRFGLICRIDPPEVPVDASDQMRELAVEASAERTFAALGRRSVDMLLLPGIPACPSWARVCAYRDEGVTRRVGLVATTSDDLDWAVRTPELDVIEVPAELVEHRPAVTASLDALASRGVVVLVVAPAPTPDASGAIADGLAAPPPWATSVVLDLTDPQRLESAIGALNR